MKKRMPLGAQLGVLMGIALLLMIVLLDRVARGLAASSPHRTGRALLRHPALHSIIYRT